MGLLIEKLIPDSQKQKQELVSRLGSDDPDLRREGVLMLRKEKLSRQIDTPTILGIMAQGDPSPLVRAASVQVLAEIGPEKIAAPVLAERVNDISPLVRTESIQALGLKNDEASRELLIKVLSLETDSEVRTEIIAALAHHPHIKTMRALIRILPEEEFNHSYAAYQSLKQITGEDFGLDSEKWEQWLKTTSDHKEK